MLKKQPKLSKKKISQNFWFKKTAKNFGLTKTPNLKESSKNYVIDKKTSNAILTVRKNLSLPKETFDRSKVLSTSTWSLNGLTFILKIYIEFCSND